MAFKYDCRALVELSLFSNRLSLWARQQLTSELYGNLQGSLVLSVEPAEKQPSYFFLFSCLVFIYDIPPPKKKGCFFVATIFIF